MKKVKVLLICLLSLKMYCQENILSGFNYIHHQLESEHLDTKVKLVISLPDDYVNSKEKYPVVYVLDGKWFFSQGVTAQSHFSRYKLTPDFIVVGIENMVEQREWYMTESTLFNSFLENKLIPFINKTFRTNSESLLFGWEASGGFVVDVLGRSPNLFSGYLAASPIPIDSTYMHTYQYRYDSIDKLLLEDNELKSYLFLATGQSDFPAQLGVDNLIELLKQNQNGNINWVYKNYKNETHSTSPYRTIHEGIQDYYKYYPVLRINSIEEYISLGETDYLESYYKNRKIKYNFSEEKNTTDYLNSCKSIVFTAMSNKNYIAFEKYLTAFLPKGLLNITHYNHASMFATFYLQNNNTEGALMLMSYYVDKFPEAARPYNILGHVFNQIGKKKKAVVYYKKAIDLGSINKDSRLSEYKKDLAKIKE